MRWEVIHDVPFERVRRMSVVGGWLYQVEVDCSTQHPDASTISVVVGWHAPIFVRDGDGHEPIFVGVGDR